MSESLLFYTHPQSRGQTVRWMLEEVGAPYEARLLDYGSTMKSPDYLAINPMGKVPAIVHNGAVVTETAAICAYLADAFPAAGLAPDPADRAAYYRWMFFAAGPMEAAFSNKAMGWEVPEVRERSLGYGTFDLAVDTLESAVNGKKYVAGEQFSAADVYVGSLIGFMLQFKLIPERPAFVDYVQPLHARPAYHRAQKIDADLMKEMQAAAG
jgi:glutathione S-transferase